jgi:hypothetical protein
MARRKYPALRSGDAYTSESKDEFDHSVSITFNYGDVYLGIDEANKIAGEYFKAVTKDFQGALNSNQFRGIIKPTIKSPGTYSATVLFPSGFKKQIDSDIRAIATIAADEMKKEIKNVIRTAPGAKGAGRIDTGLMLNSVVGRRTAYSKSQGKITVTAGWLDVWYKYFGFQEEGTVNGIKPMRAILHTAMGIFPAMYKTARMYTANFGKRVGFKGFR